VVSGILFKSDFMEGEIILVPAIPSSNFSSKLGLKFGEPEEVVLNLV